MNNNRIKEFREKANLTQKQLANELGAEQPTISNYETGFRKPDINTVRKMLSIFRARGVEANFDDIFGDTAA